MTRFVAIDLETTGLSPANHRVIEVATVTFDPSGIIETFETLVDPETSITNSHIHGIRSADVENAPRFFEIVPYLYEVLDGAILIAHNRQFDIGFLAAEFDRAGVSYEDLDAICTLELLRGASELTSRWLTDACTALGLEVLDGHQALNDAKMAASLASRLFSSATQSVEISPVTLVVPEHLSNCIVQLRKRTGNTGPASEQGDFLHELLGKLPSTTAGDSSRAAVVSEYINLLERAIGDRYISHDESESLFDYADGNGLCLRDVQLIHLTFFRDLCRAALQDRYLSQSEKADLQTVATLLSIPDWEDVLSSLGSTGAAITTWSGGIPSRSLSAEDDVIDSEFFRVESSVDFEDLSVASRLAGKSIVVTGQFTDFSRSQASTAIISRGGKSPSSVSKKTFALLVGDEAGPSKLEKASDFKVPFIDVHGFRHLLDTGELPT